MNDERERAERRRELIAARAVLQDRSARESQLRRRVEQWIEQARIASLAFFWPIRSEPDLRDTIAAWVESDSRRVAALPVIADDVLEFRSWFRDAPMRVAEYGIPVPAHGRTVEPECLLIPCVGFDHAKHRLGYGAGFYDRTLARRNPRPIAVGVAFDASRIETIRPHANDLALDVVISDAATY